MEDIKKVGKALLGLFLSSLAILSLRAIFDDGRSVVSEEGWEVLNDKDRMKEVYEKLEKFEESNGTIDVVISNKK